MIKYITILIIAVLVANCDSAGDTESASTQSQPVEKQDTNAYQVVNKKPVEGKPEAIPSNYKEEKKTVAFKLPYDMKNASLEVKLSSKLTEISGLSLTSDEKMLLAVNDEQGKIFYLDKESGEILESKKFAKSGDYEGIEQVGDIIYVVNSSGSVYEVTKLHKDEPDKEKYNTALNQTYDVEGLGYDKKTNSLLLACKNKAGEGREYAGKRAVYAFSLDSKKLSEKPVYLIDQEIIRGKKGETIWLLEELMGSFAPSAIAIHPKSKDIYILSSVGKLLVILNSKGKLIHVEELDKSEYRQPEGLCFASDGTLYMSSEGKSGKGRVYRFDY